MAQKTTASGQPPSLKDIAARVGVSVMTVSNVLRSRDPGARSVFSEDTRQRVLEAARELGYVPNRAARAMRTKRTGVVGFVEANFSADTGKVENYMVHPFLVGLNHVLAPTERHVALIELDELELQKGRVPATLRERFFDALVVHYGLTPPTLAVLEQFKIPLVYWDSGIFAENNCVYRDEFAVGRTLAERLVGLGHKRIAFYLGSGSNWDRYQKGEYVHYSFVRRYEGYAAAMKAHRLRVAFLRGYDPRQLARQIDDGGITACLTSEHYLTHLRALALLGKTVPEDFSFLACDVESGVVNRVASGGALYNRYEAGRTAGRLIVERLSGDGAPVPSAVLPVEISDGWTAGPPPADA